MQGFDLTGKVTVVTGGGGRLGSRMVTGLAGAGSEVVALTASAEEAERVPKGHGVTVLIADLTVENEVSECFGKIRDRFGPIDALIHTVGMWSGQPFLETSQADWERMLRVNLTSAFLCFREGTRLMSSGSGTIIGIASRQGADRGVAQQTAYSASKAGIVRLVEGVAEEFSGLGVAAHAIAPSTILFDGGGDGVAAADIVSYCAFLILHGASLSGETHRMYGL